MLGRRNYIEINDEAHLHPRTMEVLLKRSGKWNSRRMKAVNDLNNTCHLKSGEPRKRIKFSVPKLNREFYAVAEIDVIHWGSTKPLHAVDTAAGHSELCIIKNLCLNTIMNVLDNMWLSKHGAPTSLKRDQEFKKPSLRNWLERE